MKKFPLIAAGLALILALIMASSGITAAAQGTIEATQQPFISNFLAFLPHIWTDQLLALYPGAYNFIANGGFETNSGWEIMQTAYPAGYNTNHYHDGTRSMRAGIPVQSDNRYSYSDARQLITVPSDATFATLRMWIYPVSGEPDWEGVPPLVQEVKFGATAPTGDVQYVLILDKYDRWIDTLMWQRTNDRAWQSYVFDLSDYAGDTIYLQFGVYNNGAGGVTYMFVDDVDFEAYPPVGGPTATPTATPAYCYDLIKNGGFEDGTAWEIPLTEHSAGYSNARAHSGLRSARTGITTANNSIYSYSSVRQKVTIPSNAQTAMLSFYAFPMSTESLLNFPLPKSIDLLSFGTFGTGPLSSDVQYVLVLNKNGEWIDTLVWQRSDARSWVYYDFDLSDYAGKTIYLEFGTYNDGFGGVTAMYVDDVSLTTCPPGPVVPSPTPTTTKTPAPTVTRTPAPTATGIPANCYEEVINTSFESNSGWQIPFTEWPAGYSTTRANTGLRSMRTGITNSGDNTYSYSDAYQVVDIPSNATKATLSLWTYPISGETTALMLDFPAELLREPFGSMALSGDVQYLLVLNKSGFIQTSLIWMRSNDRAWEYSKYNMLDYAGKTIRLQYGTYNDGLNGVSSMFVDDFSLVICTP